MTQSTPQNNPSPEQKKAPVANSASTPATEDPKKAVPGKPGEQTKA